MPQPAFALSSGLAIVKFGNQPLPNGQGTMSYVNLNDRLSWFCQALGSSQGFDYDSHQLTLAQIVWRGRSAWLGEDWGPWRFQVPFKYDESPTWGGPGQPLGQALAQLALAGEQLLTFDNSTGLPCKFSKVANRKMDVSAFPPLWSFDIEFVAKATFFQDLSSTTVSPQTLASGSATTFNVTYAGSVWAEPVWTLTIPNTNAAPISSFSLSNTMSGETLTITFPGNLAASTAWTITIDSGQLTVLDQNGHSYDVAGNAFPLLYGPAGQVNPISATLTPASGTATNCTIGASYTNRWLL